LHARIRERARQFLIEQDTALSRHEKIARTSRRSISVGVGVYVFRDPPAAAGSRLDAAVRRRGRSR
jgi:hypothetical protein